MKNESTISTGIMRVGNSFALALILALAGNSATAAEIGVTADKIVIGRHQCRLRRPEGQGAQHRVRHP
jgi:hypothetical protein